jgi:hypothetical protein
MPRLFPGTGGINLKDIQNKLLASVEKLFERKQFKSLKELLSTMEPADIAEVLSEKGAAERVFLFRLLPKDLAIEVFEFLEGTEREELLASFTDTEVAASSWSVSVETKTGSSSMRSVTAVSGDARMRSSRCTVPLSFRSGLTTKDV